MMHRALFASCSFALLASMVVTLIDCAPVDAPEPARIDVVRAPASDDAPAAAVYVAPGSLVVRWSFEGERNLASACAARGVASVRIEVGLDAAVTVPCAAGARRYEGLAAGTYSVTLAPLDAAGSLTGDDLYGIAAVRSNEDATFDARF